VFGGVQTSPAGARSLARERDFRRSRRKSTTRKITMYEKSTKSTSAPAAVVVGLVVFYI